MPGVRGLRALAAALLALFCGLSPGRPSAAWAHGTLLASSIEPGSLIAALPPTLILSFSESLSQRFSSLQVTGPDGGSAVVGDPLAAQDNRSLQVHLSPRGGGTYRVVWISVSAVDGHALTGGFAFAVGFTSASGDLTAVVTSRGAGTLGVTDLLAALTHWLVLLFAIAWAGGALLETLAAGQSGRAALASGDAWVAQVGPHARTLRAHLLEMLIGVLAFGWLLDAAQLATAGRVSIAGAVVGLLAGDLGLLRLAQMALPVVALLDLRHGMHPAAGTLSGGSAGSPGAGSPRIHLPDLGRWGRLALPSLFLLALAASGHAAAITAITLSAVVLTWLHSLAGAGWIGGLAYLALAALPIVENMDLDKRAPLLLGLLRRYTPVAVSSIAVLAVTGLFAGQAEVGSRARLAGSAYGHALLIKMGLVALAVAITLYLLTVQVAGLERSWLGRQRLESLAALDRIGRTLRLSLIAGVLVLGATTALWADAPAGAVPLPAVARFQPSLPRGVWQPAGLQGLVVHRLLFQPANRHVLWAATSAGVWRSVDDQRTWTRRGAALRKIAVLDLLFLDEGRGLLAAAANGQLYRSYDQGRHWQRLGHPFGRQPLRAMAGHGTVLLAAGDDGIFRSTDDSRHWHSVLTLPGQGIATLYWSPAAGRFLAGVQRGPWQIYSADPQARQWQPLAGAPSSQAGVLALASLGGGPARFMAGAGGAGAWVAPAATGPWLPVTGIAAGSTVGSLLPDGRTLGRLFLGATDAGIYGSVDGGTTWSTLGTGGPKGVHNLVMRSGPVRILYAATDGGAYKLTIGA